MNNIKMDSVISFIGNHKKEILWGGAAIVTGWLVKNWWELRGLPPGPRGLPIVGSSALFKQDLVVMLESLQKQYGDIVCVGLGGSSYMVILNSFDVIKEVYVERGVDFLNRSVPTWINVIYGGDYTDDLFASPYNEKYRAAKKFSMQALRSAGFGKNQLDRLLSEEWQQISGAFDSTLNTEIDPTLTFKRAMTNIICGVMFNIRRSHEDKELDGYAEMMTEYFDSFDYLAFQLLEFIPVWMLPLFSSLNAKVKHAQDMTMRVESYIERIIRDHEKDFDNENVIDFVDSCIQHGLVAEKGHEYVTNLCVTFMLDAMNTVHSMMMFIFLYLIHYPSYQRKIRQEIQNIIPECDVVPLDKRAHLPLTEAFINEVFRHVCPVIVGVLNKPWETTTLRSYRIPKHFHIMPNFWAVFRDPTLFPEPERFDPMRFLDGEKLKRVEQFFPFGIGKRKCLGEQLVRSELWYFTVNMVQRYSIEATDERNMPDLTPQQGPLTRVHKPFTMVLKKI